MGKQITLCSSSLAFVEGDDDTTASVMWFFRCVNNAHCWKSSFFVQKFNFDFPRKLSIFWGEKLVKML